MKNGIVSIEIFEAMDGVRKKYGKTATEWAKVTWGKGRYVSRISELRLKVDLHRAGKYQKTGRAFSVQKCAELIEGLKRLLGEATVCKELKKLLEKAKNSTERNLLMILAIPNEDQDRIETILKAVVLKEE